MNHRITISLVPFSLGLFGGATSARAADIDVLASAALGDELGGQPAALDLFDDGTVVIGGADEDGGTIVRLDDSGVAVATLRIAEAVDDLAVDRRTGQIATVGPTELVVLASDLGILWRTPLPVLADDSARRLAIGELGTIAVVAAGELHTFSADGTALGGAPLAGVAPSGVAVLDGADLVVVTGSRSACDDRRDTVALRGLARDGAPRWNAYDDTGCDLAGTRGVDVARGEDGLVYLLAEVDGVGTPFDAATNVAFDAMTTLDDPAAHRFAYYARFSTNGEHLLGQSFLVPDEDAAVRPRAIAADSHGNVVLTGMTTHALELEDDAMFAEALYAPAGFYQQVSADFRERLLWRSLEIDDLRTEGVALALAGPRVVVLLHTSRSANDDADATPAGPMVLTFPTDPKHAIPKRPDRDDVGTFGYESGVAGSDPTCHACGPTRTPRPIGVLALAALGLIARRRPAPSERN